MNATAQIHFHSDTPQAVRNAIAAHMNQRVRLFHGDTVTGRCWNDECYTIGRLRLSRGQKSIPILVANQRSLGGLPVLDHRLIAIQTAAGKFAYQHPLFHTGIWTIKKPTRPEYAASVHCNGKLHAEFRRADQAAAYIAFMKGERWTKAPHPGAMKADNQPAMARAS